MLNIKFTQTKSDIIETYYQRKIFYVNIDINSFQKHLFYAKLSKFELLFLPKKRKIETQKLLLFKP